VVALEAVVASEATPGAALRAALGASVALAVAEAPEAVEEQAEPDAPAEGPYGILLTVAYDGRPFAGFAAQRGQRTVAGELLDALRRLDPSIWEVRSASRTDTGVHAHGQRVAFDAMLNIPPKGWAHGPARHLPPEIAVRRAAIVRAGFTPRFHGRSKRYRYLVSTESVRNPFREGRAWRIPDMAHPAALDRARREAEDFVGHHDFAAFRSAADKRRVTERTLTGVTIEPLEGHPHLLAIDVRGQTFLHNMVRILVGTLVDVGREAQPPGTVKRALTSGRRQDAGVTAPPYGLYLEEALLEEEGTDAYPSTST